MKRPSFQFYVGDWQSNSNLRRCTFAEKGIWLDVMCLMHDGDQYGALRWPLKEIAKAVGCKLVEIRGLVSKGVLKGADHGETCPAFVYTPRSGGKDGEPVTLIAEQEGPIWYSSRMVRDDHVSKSRGKGTRFGEHKNGDKPEGESKPNQRVGNEESTESLTGESSAEKPNQEKCNLPQITSQNCLSESSYCKTPIDDPPIQRLGDGASIFSLQSSPSGSKKDAVDDTSERVKEIFAWLEQFLNSTAPLFTAPVAAWLSWGADFELDIKTVAERWRKANPKKVIRSLEWLDEDIAASIQKRMKPMPEISIKSGGSDAHPKSFGSNAAAKPTFSSEGARIAAGFLTQPAGEGAADDGTSSGLRTAEAVR